MKKQLILMLLIPLTLSFSSCGSKAPMEDTTGVIESTVISESEATETQSEAESTETKSTELTESVYTPDPTSTPTPTVTPTPTSTPTTEPTVDESTMTAEEVLATVPTSVYDPSDTSLTLDEQKEKAKDALHDGTITERQYAVISKDIRERKEAASSTTTTTGSTSGDTYIPAHGNPGTPDTGEILNDDVVDINDVDMSWAIGTTIE